MELPRSPAGFDDKAEDFVFTIRRLPLKWLTLDNQAAITLALTDNCLSTVT